MAIFRVGNNVSTETVQSDFGGSGGHSSTNKTSTGYLETWSDGSTVVIAGRNLTYGSSSGHASSGTYTAITVTKNGNLGFSISDADIDVATTNSVFESNGDSLFAEFSYQLRGDDTIYGASGNETLYGFDGNDIISGGAGNDKITGGKGNDAIDGGEGADTAVFSGVRANYTITKSTDAYTVTSVAEGTDTLKSVERLKFSDKTLALDIDANAGQAYRVYQAAFNRRPDNDGLKYWIDKLDSGISLSQVASAFIGSAEFARLYGAAPSTEQFVDNLYQNVLHRSGDAGGYAYWVNELSRGAISRIDALVGFSESSENQLAVIGNIQNGIELL